LWGGPKCHKRGSQVQVSEAFLCNGQTGAGSGKGLRGGVLNQGLSKKCRSGKREVRGSFFTSQVARRFEGKGECYGRECGEEK